MIKIIYLLQNQSSPQVNSSFNQTAKNPDTIRNRSTRASFIVHANELLLSNIVNRRSSIFSNINQFDNS